MNDQDIHFDFDRDQRVGFPEIIYGESKSADQLQRIIAQCRARKRNILISRCSPEKAKTFDGGTYDTVASTWSELLYPSAPCPGSVCVVSAGTADAPVVHECLRTLEYLGIAADNVQDVGVAGIHRLFKRLPEIEQHDVVICCAGFEGALASVLGGLLKAPIIAVPTSVGYGVAEKGQAALNGMLASCANGLAVMNIDNGVGAALTARRILTLKES